MKVKFNVLKIDDNTKEFLRTHEATKEKILEAIGIQAEGYAVKEITEKKAVDTGLLRNSITHAISGKRPDKDAYRADKGDGEGKYDGQAPADKNLAVYIGTNVKYGRYIELGSVGRSARPFLRPAVTEHKEEYQKIIETAMKDA